MTLSEFRIISDSFCIEPIENIPCGSEIEVGNFTSRRIYSPNYPESYDNDEDCSWNITTDEGLILVAILTYINVSLKVLLKIGIYKSILLD